MRTSNQVRLELKRAEKEYDKVKDQRKVNHILHFILSVVTLGWWIPVWIILIMNFDTRQVTLPKKIKKLEDELMTLEITEEYGDEENVR